MGTRDAIFAIQVLFQRCRDVNTDIHACFIDYKKAFNTVKHEKLLEILKRTGVPDAELRIITNLYWNQLAKINVDEATFRICRD